MKLPETYLIEVFRPEAKHILELLTKTGDGQEDKDIQNYYKKLAQWGTEHLQKAGEIVLDKIELSYKDEVIKLGLVKRTKDLWGMINALIELMKKYSANTENVKIIQQTTLEILAGLSKMPIPKQAEDEPDPEPDPKPDPEPKTEPEPENKSGKSRDWTAYRAKKLADASKEGKTTTTVFNEFYDEYYSVEYAGVASPEKDSQGIVAKLKSLDKILIPEFTKLGYNVEVNPFASFLKILIKNKFDIFKKLTFNTYGAIHNSFIKNYITGNMLGQKFDEKNLLFCSDLYNKNGSDIIKYLNLQKQVLTEKEASKHANVDNLIAKMFIYQNVQQEQESVEDSYSVKVDNLLKLTSNINQPGSEKAKLRSLSEIHELYKYLFGAEAKTVDNKVKVDNKAVANIVEAAAKQNSMLDMIRHILNQDAYTDSKDYAQTAQKVEIWLSKQNYTPNDEYIKRSKKILSTYTIDAKAYNSIVKNLIDRINDKAGNKK
jgi:hypothetical protein